MTAQALMLSALLKKAYKGSLEAFKEFVPKGVEFVDFVLSPGKTPRGGKNVGEWLSFIHYSWLAAWVKELQEPLKPYVAAALTTAQATGLGLPAAKKAAPLIRDFLQKELYAKIASPDVLPFSLIPKTALDPLLFMNKARLVHLIDLLGIHDLALDFKKVIAKDLQMRLQELLTPLQKQYFTFCLKENLVALQTAKSPAYWLDHKNPPGLIHSAGLWRLTRLVAAEERSWIWYLVHYLDQGRGSQMQKWIEEDKDIALQGKARDKILEQVLRLVEALT